MPNKQSNKDRIKEITAGIEKGIQELFESDRYRNYLTTMSRFHRYSLNNVMLIHAQKPDATLVAGFNKWKNSFEEQELMAIYNPGTRLGLIQALNEMRTYLDEDEQELRTLTDSAVYKLSRITDDAFEKLDLIPEF